MGNISLHTGPSENVQYLTLDLLKSFFLDHLKEDHNQREFESLIIDEILNLPKRSSKTRETSIISDPQLNTITSILELLKIFSELIVAFQCGPLERIQKKIL